MKAAVFLIVSFMVMGLMTATLVSGSENDHGMAMPEKYTQMKNEFWGDPQAISAGEKIYQGKCAVCHGEKGDGRGSVAAVFPLKPADFTDKNMAATMGDGYWFWRVSKGGAFPPYNSIMPPFENVLTEEDIWHVISYVHTFSHRGMHAHEKLKKIEPHKPHDKHHDHEG